MSVELTHNGNRYMVDGGQWYRRLEVGERITTLAETYMPGWQKSTHVGYLVERGMSNSYRVPCADPRQPFTVGQRVRISRTEEDGWGKTLIGCQGEVNRAVTGVRIAVNLDGELAVMSTWCLDPVEPVDGVTASNMVYKDVHLTEEEAQHWDKVVGHTQPSIGEPCLPWILAKLSRQPGKADRTREILQRAMVELVRLEGER